MTEEKIARINALAKKSKTAGLTEAEKGPAPRIHRRHEGQPARTAGQHLYSGAGRHHPQGDPPHRPDRGAQLRTCS